MTPISGQQYATSQKVRSNQLTNSPLPDNTTGKLRDLQFLCHAPFLHPYTLHAILLSELHVCAQSPPPSPEGWIKGNNFRFKAGGDLRRPFYLITQAESYPTSIPFVAWLVVDVCVWEGGRRVIVKGVSINWHMGICGVLLRLVSPVTKLRVSLPSLAFAYLVYFSQHQN